MHNRKNSKFISRLKKVYFSCGYNKMYSSWKEFMGSFRWTGCYQNGGNINPGYGKREDEKSRHIKEKRLAKQNIERDIVEGAD